MKKMGILGDMFDIDGDGKLDMFEEVMELDFIDEDIEDFDADKFNYDDFADEFDE